MELEIRQMRARTQHDLLEAVRGECGEIDGELAFELRPRAGSDRDPSSIDPTVLVAITAGTSSALTALITGLLRLVERTRPTGRIIIEGKGGRIEVPPGTSASEIGPLVRAVKELEADSIGLP